MDLRLLSRMEATRGIPLGKWLFDKLFALVALILISPVLATVALLLRLTDDGPVFFAHERIGKDGKPFRCYKFRTMRVDSAERLARLLEIDPIARADWAEAQKLENDPRVHRVGRILRKTSLDELPQFWNVLKGDMSVVGPRPITAEEGSRYGVHLADYCAVRPGITGLWQVSGRNDTGYNERVALDVDYVRNGKLSDDFRIVFQTVAVVLMQQGAS